MEYGILFLLIIVMLCYFQTLLSMRENKYLGYIIPILTFIASIVLLVIWMDSFSIPKIIVTLLFVNIPTYILIFIYKAKQKALKKQIKKHVQ